MIHSLKTPKNLTESCRDFQKKLSEYKAITDRKSDEYFRYATEQNEPDRLIAIINEEQEINTVESMITHFIKF